MYKPKLKPFHRQNSKKSLFNKDGSTVVPLGPGGLSMLMNQDLTDWLTLNVGQRGRDWDMGNSNTQNLGTFCVAFDKPEHGTLFILTWLGRK